MLIIASATSVQNSSAVGPASGSVYVAASPLPSRVPAGDVAAERISQRTTSTAVSVERQQPSRRRRQQLADQLKLVIRA